MRREAFGRRDAEADDGDAVEAMLGVAGTLTREDFHRWAAERLATAITPLTA